MRMILAILLFGIATTSVAEASGCVFDRRTRERVCGYACVVEPNSGAAYCTNFYGGKCLIDDRGYGMCGSDCVKDTKGIGRCSQIQDGKCWLTESGDGVCN